jgi:hypothetical protein
VVSANQQERSMQSTITTDCRLLRRGKLREKRMQIENSDRSRAMSDEVYIACARYLERLGAAEYRSLVASNKGKRNVRYQPTPYHAELVRLLGQRDENGFKALKALEGRYSALGF